jgi:glycerophosphoryl diester phosphodiesterase
MSNKFATRMVVIAVLIALGPVRGFSEQLDKNKDKKKESQSVQVGPRPFYLVEGMDPSPLKDKLLSCEAGPFSRTDFSIAHRPCACDELSPSPAPSGAMPSVSRVA